MRPTVEANLGLVGLIVKTMATRKDRDEVEMAALEGLYSAVRNYEKRNDSKFSTYAHACMVGYVLTYRRRERQFRYRFWNHELRGRRHVAMILFSEISPRCVTGNTNLFARDYSPPEKDDRMELVSQAVRMLPYRLKSMIEQRFHDEMTYDQIAREWGITKERVRQLLQRAFLRVRVAAEDMAIIRPNAYILKRRGGVIPYLRMPKC